MGKIYMGKPLEIKSRKGLIAKIRPRFWKFLRADAGDLPEPTDLERIRGIARSLPDPATNGSAACLFEPPVPKALKFSY